MSNLKEGRELVKQLPYEFMVLWHPTAKQADETGAISKMIVPRDVVMAASADAAYMLVAKRIDDQYLGTPEQIEVIIRSFI